MTETRATTCPYCGVGCGVLASVENDALIAVSGDKAHPANNGKLCIKGTNLVAATGTAGRLLAPIINGRETDWNTALDSVAERLTSTVAEHGPEAVAFYLSGQLLTEDYYVANKLMKGFIGSANVDTNSRLCMASAVAAHKRAFGEDVVPCDYADFETADLVVLTGSNAAWAHPILFQRLAAARAAHGTRVVVIDPKVTATCEIADLHLAIQPGSDVDLFNALLTHLAEQDCLDQNFINAHTEGLTQALQSARLDVATASERTGVPQTRLLEFFSWFSTTEHVVTAFSQGVNQSTQGTDKASAIINCHLATGRIGRPGCGPFSITGQPNAMGGREVGGMANQLAAHMDFDAESSARVARFWRAPRIVKSPGLKAVDMFDAVADGSIKAIWIMGTNPAVSLPDSNTVRAALADCPTVIVSDCNANTDTTAFADILLPAQAWGEKDGTVTNSERFISRQRRLTTPPGSAAPDWWIVSQVASRLGYEQAFNYTSPAEIFNEHARLSAFENNGERLFNLDHLAGMSLRDYEFMQPTQWPGARPFADHRYTTPNQRARFVAVQGKPPGQLTSKDMPLILNTGRYRDQWHTMTRTGTAANLFHQAPLPQLEMHPNDAAARDITSGDVVQLDNRLGQVRLLAHVSKDVQPGNLFAPIHWSDQFSGRATVSQLVARVTDAVSGQPESKHATVACRRLNPSWRMRLVSTTLLNPKKLTNSDVLFWARFPGTEVVCYELAVANLGAVNKLLDQTDVVSFNTSEAIRVLGRHAGKPAWLFFAHRDADALPAWEHVTSLFSADTEDWRRLSLSAPADLDTSRCICTCFQVTENAINACIADGAGTVAELGERLACGTNCGSCRHTLAQLIDAGTARELAEAI